MSALRWRIVKSPPHSVISSPPLPVTIHRPLLFKSSKVFQPLNLSSILGNITSMADSNFRGSGLGQSECDEDGGKVETVSPNYVEIIAIRHGETEWNSDGRIQGHLDVDLNDVGRQQAVAVAERLSREPKISAVYSSDLKRAFETAEIIAKSCGVSEVTKDPDLRERHLGDLQGVVYREIAKIKPEAHRAFVSNRKDQEIPGGGESFNQVYERCTSALQRIAQKHKGERVVVVSHGGTIRALHRKASPHGRSVGKVLNTSVNVFHISDKDEWSIESWGDVSHLDRTGFLDSGFGGDKNSENLGGNKRRWCALFCFRASSFGQSEYVENGGDSNTRCPNYAEIVVIRHGETDWNSARRIQGQMDVDLNETGRKQALAVADRLSREPKIFAVYSSDLKRALYTAEKIAKSCGVVEVTKDPDLRERHLGDLQGLVFHEAAKINPEAHKAFGGGESYNQLYNRCTLALQRIAQKHIGERVVVVSHGATIEALHRKGSPDLQSEGKVKNTSVDVFHVSEKDEWTIKSWGDVSHLNRVGFLDSGFEGDGKSG
ncbi:hypothetical protein RD792_004128 [Penstemon davidsonii]|uniref:Phosphoglycerate mutase n=1 Tax=Penstemon davidsonii TaxID=160366 RepID=A0ABR0DGK1_9LAMI|nr:hypothetical protein RD792_004128 [Penstemon davidsonii]